jgi:hypothetical protein
MRVSVRCDARDDKNNRKAFRGGERIYQTLDYEGGRASN